MITEARLSLTAMAAASDDAARFLTGNGAMRIWVLTGLAGHLRTVATLVDQEEYQLASEALTDALRHLHEGEGVYHIREQVVPHLKTVQNIYEDLDSISPRRWGELSVTARLAKASEALRYAMVTLIQCLPFWVDRINEQ